MLLVKVGAYTINVEQVAAFVEEGDKIKVIFLPASAGNEPFSIKLDGESSQLLRAWLKKNSEGVPEESTGFAISSMKR